MRDKNFSMAWFHKLRRLADSQGFSGPSLAEYFEVTGQAVNKWLAGGAEPSYQDLLKLCSILKAPVEWVLDDSQPDEPPSPEHQTARNMYYRILNERGPEAVIACLAGASVPGRVHQGTTLPHNLVGDHKRSDREDSPGAVMGSMPGPRAGGGPYHRDLDKPATGKSDVIRVPKAKRKPF